MSSVKPFARLNRSLEKNLVQIVESSMAPKRKCFSAAGFAISDFSCGSRFTVSISARTRSRRSSRASRRRSRSADHVFRSSDRDRRLCDALGARIDFRRSVEDSGGRKSREVRKFLSERSFGGGRFPSCACLRSSKALSFLFHKSLKPMRFRSEVRLGAFICTEFCATGSRLASSVQA